MLKGRQSTGAAQARVDALLWKKTGDLLDSFLVDDNARMLKVFRDDNKYDFPLRQGTFLLPKILCNESIAIMFASFLSAIKCVRTLNDLSVDLKLMDRLELTVAHFACAGVSFDVCRELDNLGVDFSVGSKRGSPALFACEYGRDELFDVAVDAGVDSWRSAGRLVGEAGKRPGCALRRCAERALEGDPDLGGVGWDQVQVEAGRARRECGDERVPERS
jgi:hypothetical protein